MNAQVTGKTATMIEPGTVANQQVTTSRTALIGASLAALALAIIAVLALSATAKPTQADKITLLFLAILSAVCFWTPISRWVEAQEGAGTFALTAAMFVIYGMARQITPADDKGALRFAMLPEDVFPVSYAAYVAVAGALLTAPFWFRHLAGWTKAVLITLAIVSVLGFSIFKFLSGYYTVGATEVLDPTPLVHLFMQAVEYGTLALLCNAVGAHAGVQRWVLRILPSVLIALWLRHNFATPPVEEAE